MNEQGVTCFNAEQLQQGAMINEAGKLGFDSISSQEMLTSFEAALAGAIKKNGIVTNKMIKYDGWEFMLSAPGEVGLNIVVKHTRIN